MDTRPDSVQPMNISSNGSLTPPPITSFTPSKFVRSDEQNMHDLPPVREFSPFNDDPKNSLEPSTSFTAFTSTPTHSLNEFSREQSPNYPLSFSKVFSNSSKDDSFFPSHINHFNYLNVAAYYLRFFFHLFLSLTVLFIIWSVIFSLRADILSNVSLEQDRLLIEIKECTEQYLSNKCHPEDRVPAVKLSCQEWEICMRKDPTVHFGYSKIAIRVFAEMLEEFFGTLSYKTMIFFIVVLFTILYFSVVPFQWAQKAPNHHWNDPNSHLRFPSKSSSVSYNMSDQPDPLYSNSLSIQKR